MKCLNQYCDATEIESDDNFCYKCGHWTTKGYSFLNDKSNVEIVTNGEAIKQNGRLSILAGLFASLFIIFSLSLIFRGEDLFKPFFYVKKMSFNYIYGYNTTFLKTDNKYNKENINSYEEAIDFIKNDFASQNLICFNSLDVDKLITKLEDNYQIPSISFCDMSVEESTKLKDVIDKMYTLFPNMKGSLTNITITNAKKDSKYIARFQPMYQFVNVGENINNYNKVNKTQILLNSYYFLNKSILSNDIESYVGKNWYVEDANWESTIAHEFGHYISFVSLLKKHNISNITFVTKDNNLLYDSVIDEFNSGDYSLKIVNEALNNYNVKYKTNLSIDEFASTISKYASSKNKSGNLIADETIAEAIHDYYLHGANMKQSSREIVDLIKGRL